MLSLLLSASICKADIQYDAATGVVTVTANEEWTADEWYDVFPGIKNFTKAILKGTYGTIPREAFSGSLNMTEIDIQAPIVNISAYAFAQCDSLTTFTLPDTVEYVGYGAFSTCANLQTFYWKNHNQYFAEYVFSNCAKLTTFDHFEGDTTQPVEGKKYIYQNYTFVSCIALTTCNFPDSVGFLAPHLFDGCIALSKFILPSRVVVINEFTFQAAGLTEIDASQVYSIKQFAFAGCTSLTAIKLSDKLRFIGAHAFETCIKLQTVEGITNHNNFTFENSAFEGAIALTSFHIPTCMTKIPDYSFHNAEALSSVTIPDAVTYIGKYAFLNTSLISIYIPGNVSTIMEGAFGLLKNLKEIKVSEANANFKAVKNLLMRTDGKLVMNYPQTNTDKKLVIPDGVEFIGQYCYSYSQVATEIVFPSTLINIGLHAFAGCKSLTSITLPESLVTIEDYAFSGCSELVEASLQGFSLCMGAFAYCKSLKRVTFPQKFQAIGNEAFRNCAALEEINLKDTNLTTLSNASFIFCYGLKKVTLPDTVTEIPTSCFLYCKALTTFNFPSKLTRIKNSAFNGCDNLKTITLPETLKYLGSKAFTGTALQHITVPASVTYIAAEVFSNIKTLESAEFKGVLRTIKQNVFANDERLTKIQFWDDIKNVDKLALEGTRVLSSILYCGQVAVDGTFVADHSQYGTSITVTVGTDYPTDKFGGVTVEKKEGVCIPHRTPAPTPEMTPAATPARTPQQTEQPDKSKNKKLYIAIGVSGAVIILSIILVAFIVKCCMVKRGWVKKETLTESLLTQTV